MENKYNVDYFIKKFEAIPEENWTMYNFYNIKKQFCALGHCGMSSIQYTCEAQALILLFKSSDKSIVYVNDNQDESYQQHTPKQRVLAALYDIKKIKENSNENF